MTTTASVPIAIDLFSGIGGVSQSMQKAGYAPSLRAPRSGGGT